jgi:hypothetical protein
MIISLYSPFIACISAIPSTPVFGAGLGGGGGGMSLKVRATRKGDVDLFTGILEGGSEGV